MSLERAVRAKVNEKFSENYIVKMSENISTKHQQGYNSKRKSSAICKFKNSFDSQMFMSFEFKLKICTMDMYKSKENLGHLAYNICVQRPRPIKMGRVQ